MRNPSVPRRVSGLVATLGAFALLASACSGGEAGASTDIATLESDAGSEIETDAGTAATVTDPDEAALAFSACMRDEGIDFPDLSVDADGNIELREAFQTVDRNAEGFREATETCNPLLGETAFGGRRAAADSPEIQDGLLAFSDCVRDAGYDVGDLTLGGRPGAGQGDGNAAANADATAATGGDADGDAAADGDGAGRGQRQEGFGNRNARFAEQLELDYEDPEVAATIDGCMPIIEEAFANAGIGQGGGGNGAGGNGGGNN